MLLKEIIQVRSKNHMKLTNTLLGRNEYLSADSHLHSLCLCLPTHLSAYNSSRIAEGRFKKFYIAEFY
jgi:hypothetical protein